MNAHISSISTGLGTEPLVENLEEFSLSWVGEQKSLEKLVRA